MADGAAATQQAAAGANQTGAAAATGTIATGAPASTTAAANGQPATTTAQTGAEGTQQAATQAGTTAAATTTPAAPVELKAADLTLPKGFDAAVAEQVAGLAKSLGWDKGAAQKYLDHVATQAPALEQARQAAHDKEVQGWVTAVEADKAFGGANLEATKTNASRAIKALVERGELTKTDIDFLESTGYGNHPILVKLAASLGKTMGEDGFGGRNSGGQKTDLRSVYKSMPNA